MSLDIDLIKVQETSVWECHITHNLGEMAEAAGVYRYVWRPDECDDVTRAGDLVEPLTAGLKRLIADPEKFRELEPVNGWGTYDQFIPWLERYITACEADPDASVVASR